MDKITSQCSMGNFKIHEYSCEFFVVSMTESARKKSQRFASQNQARARLEASPTSGIQGLSRLKFTTLLRRGILSYFLFERKEAFSQMSEIFASLPTLSAERERC